MSDDLLPVAERFRHPIGPQVHAILWLEWDPIGVNDIAPDDEYDSYVGPVIDSVMKGEGAERIAGYLDWVAKELMGLGDPRDPSHTLGVARKLAALRSTPE
ncbi:hypothetical protein [Brevundimonas sp. Root1279]|uniref:hypothetical protein n=1 Tax=Brevundimonas sp. Root1279 TaxID=1736443 RepID=UPI0006F2987F|nr:hypothetical protein [Brevundimonas sp. Root1279]KQW83713.1 hypothetical protein ASC65_03405 [Brevundimonas sp. Root1279]